MTWFNLSILLTFIGLIAVAHPNPIDQLDSLCQDWESFNNEKCYKIIKDKLADFESAKTTCRNYQNSSLLIIESWEEQRFLGNFIFNASNVVDNVWIGLRRYSNNYSFQWIDGSRLTYTNWQWNYPTNKRGKDCVDLVPDDGYWANDDCQKRNVVVCQRLPVIPLNEVPAMLMRMQRRMKQQDLRFRDQDDRIQNQESIIRNQGYKITNQETKIREVEKEIEKIKNDLRTTKIPETTTTRYTTTRYTTIMPTTTNATVTTEKPNATTTRYTTTKIPLTSTIKTTKMPNVTTTRYTRKPTYKPTNATISPTEE